MRMLPYVVVGVLVIAVVVLVGMWSARARAAGEKRAREPERLTARATKEDLLEAEGRAMTTAARVEARRTGR
jgi:hypothetical protein